MIRFVLTALLVLVTFVAWGNERPNVVLLMCDDLGYGDTGFNGHPIIQTPHLDAMAREGALLTNFHAGGPVCSPTRGTCLTGRHYYRYGIWSANQGHLPAEEITLARMLKGHGYATGHFGKWHLGTLSKTMSSKGPRRKAEIHYSPPWERDYDTSFVTESAVATWDPAKHERYNSNPYYEDGRVATENLDGDDSRVLMDRAIPFIEHSVQSKKPFLAVIWFHAPHIPVIAGPEYLKMYEGHGDAAHYYGCITAVDDQVGRLRKRLADLEVADDTVMFFCSDNGPEGKQPKGVTAGTTKGLRGRKRSLYEGGVRVPALVLWPGKIDSGTVVDAPLSTLDYFPTIANVIGYKMPDDRPLDGVDMLAIVQNKSHLRPPIIFRHDDRATVIDHDYKLVVSDYSGDGELYDLSEDWSEATNLLSSHPQRRERMLKWIQSFEQSAQRSHAGKDYPGDFSPTGQWRPLGKDADAKAKKNR